MVVNEQRKNFLTGTKLDYLLVNIWTTQTRSFI